MRVAGLGVSRADRRGVARFYLPGADDYALEISTAQHEEVLYEEALEPGKTYTYRPQEGVSVGRYYVLQPEPD